VGDRKDKEDQERTLSLHHFLLHPIGVLILKEGLLHFSCLPSVDSWVLFPFPNGGWNLAERLGLHYLNLVMEKMMGMKMM